MADTVAPKKRLSRRRGTSVVAAFVAGACFEVRAPLDGWLSGCTNVEAGPRCIAPIDQSVTVFVPGVRLPIQVALDNQLLMDLAPSQTPDGVRFQLKVSRPGRLEVRSVRGVFAAELTHKERADPEAIGLSKAARTHLRDGDWPSAVQAFDQASSLHMAGGAWTRGIRDLQAAAFALLYEGYRPDEARKRLSRAQEWLQNDRGSWAIHPYYEGLLAIRSGDLFTALARLQEARERLLSVEADRRLVAGVDEPLAVVLQRLGRESESEAVLKRLLAVEDSNPCVRARRFNNAAWAGLLAAEASGLAPSAITISLVEGAVSNYAHPDCIKRTGRMSALLHLAYARVLESNFVGAEETLTEVEPRRIDEKLWHQELLGRAEVGLGRAHAGLRRYDAALTQLAHASEGHVLLTDQAWRLHIGRARAARATGNRALALSAYAEADALLAGGALRIPFGSGRAPFTETRGRGAAEWAELLIAANRPAEAACVLRRVRTRAIARAAAGLHLVNLSAEARQIWDEGIGNYERTRNEMEEAAQDAWQLADSEHQRFLAEQAARNREAARHLARALAAIELHASPLSCDDLRGPMAEEVLLVYARLPGGYAGFSFTAKGGTRVHRFDASPEPDGWFLPFDSELDTARRVRLIVAPDHVLMDLHARTWRGRPLNVQRPVVFGLDLPHRQDNRLSGRSMRALVVGDPGRNLSGARSEARTVSRALGESGWVVEAVEGTSATPQALRRTLPHVDLLHFAGHGLRATNSPWGDQLSLHQGGLSTRDIVTLEGVPRWVVLTGCKTGFERASGSLERLGLAQSFLLAGSEVVLGATRDVSDAWARDLGQAMYTGNPAASPDPAAAFQRYVSRIESNSPARTGAAHPPWSAFRVWVP